MSALSFVLHADSYALALCRFYVVKVRLQHNTGLQTVSLPVAVFRVMRDEGVRGAWRGLPPRLIWSIPLGAATFTYYQVP